MSLFLSGAMVVAFAPAIGAAVSSDVEVAFAAADDVNHLDKVTSVTFGENTYTASNDKVEIPAALLSSIYKQAAINDQDGKTDDNDYYDNAAGLAIAGVSTNDLCPAVKLDASQWDFKIKEVAQTKTYKAPSTTPSSVTIKNAANFSDDGTTRSFPLKGLYEDTDGDKEATADYNDKNPTADNSEYYITKSGNDWENAVQNKSEVTLTKVTATDQTIAAYPKTDYLWFKLSSTAVYEETVTPTHYTLTATAKKVAGNPYYYDNNGNELLTSPKKVSVDLYAAESTAASVADVHWTYDGHQYTDTKTTPNYNTLSVTYDGADYIARIATHAYDKDKKELTQGTDYDYYVTDESNHKITTEAIDVGVYEIHVVTSDYGQSNEGTAEEWVLNLTITPAPVKDAAWANGKVTDENSTGTNTSTVEYTGSAIEVTPTYYTDTATFSNGKLDKDSVGKETKGDASIYTTTITFKAGANAAQYEKVTTPTTVTEIKDCGEYTIKMVPQVTAAGYKNYNTKTLTYKVIVTPMAATYLEIDSTKMAQNSDGQVVYSGTDIEPAATLYSNDTVEGGTVQAIPESAYKLVLKKATTVTTDHNANGYTTVDAVNGPGYYGIWAIDADATDAYDVTDEIVTYFQVVEKGEEPVVVEKQDQDIKFTTGKNQKLKKGKKLQLKVTGAKTAVTYTKKSGSAFLTVSKSGKIKVDSSAKKGKTYHINVKAKAAASDAYNADTEVKHFCIKVK